MSTSASVTTPAGGRADRVGFGIALALIVAVTFALQDAASKLLVQHYSPFQTSMVRYWGFALFSLLLAVRQAPLRQSLRSRAPLLQVFRGVLLVLDIWFFSMALQTVPLPEIQSIVLIYPLMVTLLAVPFLGERVGVFRIVAVGVGFAGALIIVRPGGLPLEWGALAGLGSAITYALYLVLTRKISEHDSTAVSMVYVALVGLVMTTGVGIWHWQAIQPSDALLFLLIAVTTCIGHGFMMKALSLAPASVLQPFNYLAIPFAIVLSVWVFDYLVDPTSMLGGAIVVGAGLVVMARERWLNRRRAKSKDVLPAIASSRPGD